MKSPNPPSSDHPRPRWLSLWIIAAGCVLVALLVLFRPGAHKDSTASSGVASNTAAAPQPSAASGRDFRVPRLQSGTAPADTRPAEEIVGEKISRFALHHQDLVARMAKHYNATLPDGVNRFFAAVQAGNWPETTNLFAALKQLRMSTNQPANFLSVWPAILETYGVAEQAHAWPAQKLLDYGHAILDSLRPGMVYVGGTDAGRFIPTLLADTAEGDSRIVLTQNALADGTYLEYLRFRYGDQLSALTGEDSQKSFQTYLDDAQKRLRHDQEFPNEPKQLRPGENIRATEGRIQVSGQVAVMAINEQLLQTLVQKNPDLSFALEESFPLKSLYANATTLGPITELRANATANPLTPERATQSLDYWRGATQDLLATDPIALNAPRDAYTKLILGQANLFLNRDLTAEAGQAYQLANSLSPANPETVFNYTTLLLKQNRKDDARQVVQTAANLAPDNKQFRDLLNQLSPPK